MRNLLFLVATFATTLVGTEASLAAPESHDGDGYVHLAERAVPHGHQLGVIGMNWKASSTVRLWWDRAEGRRLLGVVRAERHGEFGVYVEIPPDARPGLHRIVAEGLSSNGAPRVLNTGLKVVAGSPAARPAPWLTDGEQPALATGLAALAGLLTLRAVARRRSFRRLRRSLAGR